MLDKSPQTHEKSSHVRRGYNYSMFEDSGPKTLPIMALGPGYSNIGYLDYSSTTCTLSRFARDRPNLGSAQIQEQSPKGILVVIPGPYYNLIRGLLLYLG